MTCFEFFFFFFKIRLQRKKTRGNLLGSRAAVVIRRYYVIRLTFAGTTYVTFDVQKMHCKT